MKYTSSLKENMIGVIMYLFEKHMEYSCKVPISEELLIAELLEQGFAHEAIHKGVKWLKELNQQQKHIRHNPPRQKSLRIYDEDECEVMNTTCRAFIMNLEASNVLNPQNRELVVNQIMELDYYPVTLAQVKWVTLMVLYNQPDQQKALLCMESLVLNDMDGMIH